MDECPSSVNDAEYVRVQFLQMYAFVYLTQVIIQNLLNLELGESLPTLLHIV